MAEEPRGGECARRGGGGSEEKRKWQQEEEGSPCPICLEAVALGEDRGPEVLVLNCGHRLHLDCWLACTVPTVAGGSGLDKYVENRVCRKCPLCRSAYSSGTVEYVQELRSVVEVASSLLESRVRKRAQAMVDKIRHKQAQLNLQTTDVDRRDFFDREMRDFKQRMPLGDADIYAALMHPIWDRRLVVAESDRDPNHRLNNFIRAELQRHGLSTSGDRSILIQRLITNDLVTTGFFRDLRDEACLLTDAQPLRSKIEKILEGSTMHVGEHHKSQQMKLVNSVAEAVTREVMMQNQGELPWPLADEPLDSAGDVEDPVEQVDEPEDRAIWTGDQLQGAQGGEENPQDDPTEARSGRGDPRDRSVEAQAGGRAGEEEEAHEDDGEEPFWASELSQLEDMGFRDRSHCTAVLSAVGGNISAAIGVLLNS